MSDWTPDIRRRLTAEFGDNPWVCVMATCDHGGEPRAQGMVCREIDPQGRLIFISDRRLGENDDLRSHATCEIVFWLRHKQTQIHVRGTTALIDAETDLFVRESMWERLSDATRSIFTDCADTDGSTMPPTFELLIVSPEKVELRELSTTPTQRHVWCTTGQEWVTANVL